MPETGRTQDDEDALRFARILIAGQDRRSRMFREGLLVDPGWNILLDLFVARFERRSICIGSLCIAARVPTSTAYRHIRDMEEHGELRRIPDRTDQRRVLVEITDATFALMHAHLLSLKLDARAAFGDRSTRDNHLGISTPSRR